MDKKSQELSHIRHKMKVAKAIHTLNILGIPCKADNEYELRACREAQMTSAFADDPDLQKLLEEEERLEEVLLAESHSPNLLAHSSIMEWAIPYGEAYKDG